MEKQGVMEDFMNSDLVKAVVSRPFVTNVSSVDYEVNQSASLITRGLKQVVEASSMLTEALLFMVHLQHLGLTFGQKHKKNIITYSMKSKYNPIFVALGFAILLIASSYFLKGRSIGTWVDSGIYIVGTYLLFSYYGTPSKKCSQEK